MDLNLHLLISHLKNINEYIPKKKVKVDLEKMKLKLSQYSTSVYNNICLIENQNSIQKAQSSTNTYKAQLRTQNSECMCVHEYIDCVCVCVCVDVRVC